MPEVETITLTADEFGNFFSEYRPLYIKLAYSYVHDIDVAKDLVTDCFLYIWEHRDTLTWGNGIRSYLYQCVRDKSYMYLRKQQALAKAKDHISKTAYWRMETSINALENNDFTKELFQAEIFEIFNEEFAKMPELTQKIFYASRVEELSRQEIALKYNLSPRKVAFEMSKAYAMLRLQLKDYLVIALILFSSIRE